MIIKLPTGNRFDMIMINIRNRIILSASTMLAIPCVILACTHGVLPEPAASVVPDSVAWIDSNTIRASVTAYPVVEGSETERRESARDEAICRAQRMVADTFVATICDKMPGEPDYEWVGKTAEVNLHGIIVGGKIVSEEYGKNLMCRIVYDVGYSGLKSRIDRFLQKEKPSSLKADGIIPGACRRNNEARIRVERDKEVNYRNRLEAERKKKEVAGKKEEEERRKKLDIEMASIPECDVHKGIRDGFDGEHAYFFTTIGTSPKAVTDTNERRKVAARLAISKVRRDLLHKFVEIFVQQGCPAGACNTEILKLNLTRTFGKAIDNGKVVCHMFDNNGNCEIVFRIQKKNLKKELQYGYYWGED